ncbi:MAG TPA: TetR/AcrR family transcriptional regulator [Streptosporangiaceae bacterium]|nr:TetR/AcrR family transcriptional regulator [Streptosporangiaceae bacterium]
MSRLTRAQAQERNRARVLAAARREFAERGYRDARIDSIAERADLTRGAVYSNFPGKRALYFTILAQDAEQADGADGADGAEPGGTAAEALGGLARAWLAGLPLAADPAGVAARLGDDLLPEIQASEPARSAFAQLVKLNAMLLGLCIERQLGSRARQVRTAEAVLTVLYGASQLSAAAPGYGDPFDLARVCEHLAGLDLGDRWAPPHLPHTAPARPADDPWTPPPATDLVRAGPARLAGDGVVTVLGLRRLAAAEEAVRAAPAGATVTVVVVTGDAGELAPLARLAIAGLTGLLRRAFPAAARPGVQVVLDETGAVAWAAGVPAVSDSTESAVRVRSGRIVARAEGPGAGHAAATSR